MKKLVVKYLDGFTKIYNMQIFSKGPTSIFVVKDQLYWNINVYVTFSHYTKGSRIPVYKEIPEQTYRNFIKRV